MDRLTNALCLLLLLAVPVWGQIVIENETVRLELRGAIVTSLCDKERGREYIASEPVNNVGLFHIVLVKDDKPAAELDAAEMSPGRPEGDGAAIRISFDGPRARAQVHVNLADSPGEVGWAISVEPKEDDMAIGRVDFPVLQMRRPLDAEGGRDNLLYPFAEGRLLPASSGSYWRTYPSTMAAQMVGYYNTNGGCLLWTDDTAGHSKVFGFQAQGKPRIALQVRHLMPYAPGRKWDSPYRVRTTFFSGCWQAAADIYRTWQSGQFWCKTKLRDRKDIPDLLRHPPLCISSQLTRENIEDLPERLAAYRERFRAPIIYRPLGWEKNGAWTGIDYFPPYPGAEQFRRLAERLREKEIYMCGFISGYYWTCSRDNASEEVNRRLAQYFQEHRGAEICERGADGRLVEQASEGRHADHICRGTDFGKRFLQETADQLFDLGVTVIHDDQDPGPRPDGVAGCFDRSHGHPIPCGPWSTQVMMEAFSQIKADAARRKIENFFLTKEYNAELFNMTLHGYQTRNFHDSVIPGLVPIVQYLNHEYIPVIFGWVTATQPSIRDLAAMVIYGQVPCIAFWNAPVEPVDRIPQNGVAFLQDCFAAMNTHAKPYLLYGKMLRPMMQEIPTAIRKVTRWKSQVFDPPRELRVPLVVQSAWEDESGNVGVFAVNLSRDELTVNCPAPTEGSWQAGFYIGGQIEQTRQVAEGKQIAWKLAPERLQSIVFSSTIDKGNAEKEPRR